MTRIKSSALSLNTNADHLLAVIRRMPPKVQTFRALYPFEVCEADELEMIAGDLIEVTIVHAGAFILVLHLPSTESRNRRMGSWTLKEDAKDRILSLELRRAVTSNQESSSS